MQKNGANVLTQVTSVNGWLVDWGQKNSQVALPGNFTEVPGQPMKHITYHEKSHLYSHLNL